MRLDQFVERCETLVNDGDLNEMREALQKLADAARGYAPQTHVEMMAFDEITDALT